MPPRMRASALSFLLLSSTVLLGAACKKAPNDGKSSTLETTSASASAGPAVTSTPVGPGEKPKPVKGPVEYALGESGVAVHIPAGLAIVPSEIEGFFDIQKGDAQRGTAIAKISHGFEPKTPAEQEKSVCGEGGQKNIVTKPIPGGGLITSCEGSSQGIKVAGMDIKTTKVRANFPIEAKNRDSSWGAWECSYESDNAENIELTKKVCATFHAVPVTHAVDPETKNLKPGATCFRDSNCEWSFDCGSPECKAKSGGSHQKVCRVSVDHGTVGQACGATRSLDMLQYHPQSPAYVPESGKTVICNILDDDLFCDPSSWTCQHPAKLGGACGDKMACAKDTVCKSGTCVAAGKPGESCADKKCAGGSRCDDKKICRAYAPTGSPCVIGKNDCEHGCSDKKCSPKPAPRQCSL